jgi:predicted lipoprotein with Yx(FWY)xxD motif
VSLVVNERHSQSLCQLPHVERRRQRHARIAAARPLEPDRPSGPALELRRARTDPEPRQTSVAREGISAERRLYEQPSTISGREMPRLINIHRARRRRSAAVLVAAVAGFATAALVGAAIAKTFTLQVAKNAKVTNTMGMTTRENIVVNSRSHAVYDLTGDSKNHPECTKAKGCFQFWPPVTVSSAKQLSKAPGINGKLGIWHRNGFLQVTLAGHPLYRFAPDSQKNAATGEGIHSFGGTWHVLRPAASGSGSSTTTMTGTTSTTTTTTTMPCLYPPCY